MARAKAEGFDLRKAMLTEMFSNSDAFLRWEESREITVAIDDLNCDRDHRDFCFWDPRDRQDMMVEGWILENEAE